MQDNESKQQTSVSAMSERGTIGGVIPNSSSTRSFVNMLSNCQLMMQATLLVGVSNRPVLLQN